ncbi:acyltransferase [Phycicoccus sp. MAQZ13P-2]|uniref:acyltransferase family protein n=1 Tax=Phycicoccus mangrovi TaxID=2840470 RepID=UPI001C005F26|nr:acyltransferase family protein [Phycicoccus mangrovi]MBT9254262.1 acyltransferase [Phycicoccus mangrovi]MBT9272640.1 acyltransferase [Phycicoccus mangrovi]
MRTEWTLAGTTRSGADPRDRAGLRRDVEGLRTLAVGLVLAYHLLGGPSGGFVGVDVFFVVSGFVITTGLVREVEATGRLSLRRFYARRARRLLPAAGIVLGLTVLAAWFLAPRAERMVVGGDVAGAAGYVVNWVFASRSVDYLAEDVGPSPVLHFWSLSVEEQYYLVWPLLIVALLWLRARRGARPDRWHLALGLGALVVVPSLALSVWYTARAAEEAFFVTPTRLWEMGVGALVALGAGVWARLHPAGAAALGWAGLAALVASAVVVDEGTAWPGTAALLPVLGTAAVVVAGFAAGRLGPERVLGVEPAIRVGALSYSLYLWHWPLLVVAGWLGLGDGLDVGLGVLLATSLLALASFHLVEDRLRRGILAGRTGAALATGAAVTVGGVVLGLVLAADARAEAAARGERTTAPLPPAVLEVPTELTGAAPAPLYDRLTPSPAGAPLDLGPLRDRGCDTVLASAELSECVVGDPEGDLEVAVAGDSKVLQWAAVVAAVGERRGWRVRVLTKSACPLLDPAVGLPLSHPTCRPWRAAALDRLERSTPDVVVTTSLVSQALDGDRRSTVTYRDGLARTWQDLVGRGAVVVALSDTPHPPTGMDPAYECVADHEDDPAACTWPLRRTPASTALERTAREVDGAVFADLDPWVCPGDLCRATYRGVLTYRQGSHVTDTYAATLTGPVEALLDAAQAQARAEVSR